MKIQVVALPCGVWLRRIVVLRGVLWFVDVNGNLTALA